MLYSKTYVADVLVGKEQSSEMFTLLRYSKHSLTFCTCQSFFESIRISRLLLLENSLSALCHKNQQTDVLGKLICIHLNVFFPFLSCFSFNDCIVS